MQHPPPRQAPSARSSGRILSLLCLRIRIINTYCFFNFRLIGVPCTEVNSAIVTQIKAMGSYTVRKHRQKLFVSLYINSCHGNVAFSAIAFQLGSVTSAAIQANHTSGVGQIESVNFTMTPTSVILGCHVQVSLRPLSYCVFVLVHFFCLFFHSDNFLYPELRDLMVFAIPYFYCIFEEKCYHCYTLKTFACTLYPLKMKYQGKGREKKDDITARDTV